MLNLSSSGCDPHFKSQMNCLSGPREELRHNTGCTRPMPLVLKIKNKWDELGMSYVLCFV